MSLGGESGESGRRVRLVWAESQVSLGGESGESGRRVR